MKRTLLIDGDIIVYRSSNNVEHEVNWGEDVWSLYADVKEAKPLVERYLEQLIEMTSADDLIFTFSSDNNFRKEVLPTYKSNRKGVRKPVCYKGLKEWVEDEYNTIAMPNLEGDDVLGILATNGSIEGETVIVSEDKDMQTVPGLLFRNNEMSCISEKEADYFHLYQTLVGDNTDGYKGCPGIGPKTASRLLDEAANWDTVVNAYEKAGLTEEDALVQARVARILRASDYDQSTQEPILWTPTK